MILIILTFNSTYDLYKIIYNVKPDTDDVDLRLQFFMTTNASGDAGSVISGNNHSYQNGSFLVLIEIPILVLIQ